MDEARTPTANLIGKAGVGLAMFHLARLGHEFVMTSTCSHAGDLWVDFGNGPETVEVKTTARPQWSLRRDQTNRVKWVILVNISDADCWLLPVSALGGGWRKTEKDNLLVLGKNLLSLGAKSLHASAPSILRIAKPTRPIRTGTRKPRMVKKVLASGEVKYYEYPR